MIDPDLKEEFNLLIRQLNERLAKPSSPKTFWAVVLNSPFLVTVVGGVMITLLSLSLQQKATESREKVARQQLAQERKHQMMVEFAQGMNQFLQHAPEVKTRQIFIAKNKNDSERDNLRFKDGRTWRETLEKYEVTLASFNLMKNPDCLCAQAAAVFEDSDLLKELVAMDRLMDEFMETDDPSNLSALSSAAADKLQQVMALMGKELKTIPYK